MGRLNLKNRSLNTSIVFNIFCLLLMLYVSSYEDGVSDGVNHIAGAGIAMLLVFLYFIILFICIIIIVVQGFIRKNFLECLTYILSLFLITIICIVSDML